MAMGTSSPARMTDKPLPPKAAQGRSVAAVDRALDLLQAIVRLGPSSLASIAEAAGCTRSLAYRMLRTLELRGFALQDGARGFWRLGPQNLTLGRAAVEQDALAAGAQAVLVSLSGASGENAYLMAREGTASQVIAAHKADPKLWQHDAIGKTHQMHAGPARLLLAHAPVEVQKQVLAERLARLTPRTRTDPAWVAADLRRIRARGYLLTVDEVHEGGIAVAAPVRDQGGAVIAVLYIAASLLRLAPVRAQTLVPMVLDHADRLSRILGYAESSHAQSGIT
jgi:DNA-binding IclR family transcriptional regulator